MTYRPDHRPFDEPPRRPERSPAPTWQLPRQRGHSDDPQATPARGPSQPDDGRPWRPHEHAPASFGEPTPPRGFPTPPHGLARRLGPAETPPRFDPERPVPVRGDLFAPQPPRSGPEHSPPPAPDAMPPQEVPRPQPVKATNAESDASFISVPRVAATVGILVAIMVLVFFLVQALQMTTAD